MNILEAKLKRGFFNRNSGGGGGGGGAAAAAAVNALRTPGKHE
jgi:hypothetical protein